MLKGECDTGSSSTNPNNPMAQCHTLLIEATRIKRTLAVRCFYASLPATLPAQTESRFLLQSISCLETFICTTVHGPELLIVFGNQLRVLFEGVGTLDARSAALGPRSFDRLAETGESVFMLNSTNEWFKIFWR